MGRRRSYSLLPRYTAKGRALKLAAEIIRGKNGREYPSLFQVDNDTKKNDKKNKK